MYASFLYEMWMPWDSKVNEDVRGEGGGGRRARGWQRKKAVKLCVWRSTVAATAFVAPFAALQMLSVFYTRTHTYAHLLEHTCTHTHIERERERNYPIAVPNELNFHFFAPTVSQAQPSVRPPPAPPHVPLPLAWFSGWAALALPDPPHACKGCQLHGPAQHTQSAQLEEEEDSLLSLVGESWFGSSFSCFNITAAH